MKSHKISFARIDRLSPILGEVFVDHGTEVDVKMVDEIHAAFRSILPSSFSVLINKSKAYSSHLDALEKFGLLAELDKIAVYAPNELARISADFSAAIPSSESLDIKVFSERDEALDWLTSS